MAAATYRPEMRNDIAPEIGRCRVPVQQDDGTPTADVHMTDLGVEHFRTTSPMGICGANDQIGQSAQFLGGRALFF
jgi:hypothetical protein